MGLQSFMEGFNSCKTQYEDADLFSSVGLARVKKNGLFGFINRLGDLEIPCTYEYAGTFYAGQTSYPKEIACVGQDQYINRKGVLLLLGSEPEPDEEITSGYYLFPKSAMDYFTFSVDSNYQIIRKKTNVMDSMDVEFFDPFTKELVIKVNNKMGVVDIMVIKLFRLFIIKSLNKLILMNIILVD